MLDRTLSELPDRPRGAIRGLPAFTAAVPLLVAIRGAMQTRIRDLELGRAIELTSEADPLIAAGSGWHSAEEWGRWSEATSLLPIKIGQKDQGRTDLALSGLVYVYGTVNEPRIIEISASSKLLTRFTIPPFESRPLFFKCRLPPPGPLLELTFSFPNAASPARRGEADQRVLGGGFQWLMISQVGMDSNVVPPDAIALDLIADEIVQQEGRSIRDTLHPLLPISARHAIHFDDPEAKVTGNTEADADGCWIGHAQFEIRLPANDEPMDAGPSLALLLLVQHLAITETKSLLKINIADREYLHRFEQQRSGLSILRVGPLPYTSAANILVNVKAECAGTRAVKLRLGTTVRWREPLPDLPHRVTLVEVPPQISRRDPVDITLASGAADDAAEFFRRWQHRAETEAKKTGFRLNQLIKSQREFERSVLGAMKVQELSRERWQERILTDLAQRSERAERSLLSGLTDALNSNAFSDLAAMNDRIDNLERALTTTLEKQHGELGRVHSEIINGLGDMIAEGAAGFQRLIRDFLDRQPLSVENFEVELSRQLESLFVQQEIMRRENAAEDREQHSVVIRAVFDQCVASALSQSAAVREAERTELIVGLHGKVDSIARRVAIPLDSKTMIVRVESGYVLVPRADHVLLVFLYDGAGSYEAETSAAFRRLVQPGMHVVDVGANVGIHTITLGRLVGNGRVTAVEPSPNIIPLLSMTAAINGLQSKVAVVGKAAGDKAGSAKLYAGITSGHASLFGEEGALEKFDIEVDRLDRLVKGPADIVKIDAEGMELAILAGMSRLLRNRDIVLIVEFGREHLRHGGRTPRQWFGDFIRRGFCAFQIVEGGSFREADVHDPSDGNYVFVRPQTRLWSIVQGGGF